MTAMANTAQDGNGSPPRPGTDGKQERSHDMET